MYNVQISVDWKSTLFATNASTLYLKLKHLDVSDPTPTLIFFSDEPFVSNIDNKKQFIVSLYQRPTKRKKNKINK